MTAQKNIQAIIVKSCNEIDKKGTEKQMKNPDTANLWLSLKELGNFKDTYYDNSLLNDLRHELSIGADDDIEKVIPELAPERVLDAFFAAVSPLSAMYADILNLFEHWGAGRSTENVTIEFDISKSKCTRFDLSHFMHAEQVLETVRELTNKMRPAVDEAEVLWYILDRLKYKTQNVRNETFWQWKEEYKGKTDSWPEKELDFAFVIDGLPIRDELLKAFRFWQTLFDFYQNICPSRNVAEMWRDHSNDKSTASRLLLAETDHCLLSSLENLYFIAENFPHFSESLFRISLRTSFRRIFPRLALLNLEIHKGFLRFRALTGEKSAQKSAHAEILNRL